MSLADDCPVKFAKIGCFKDRGSYNAPSGPTRPLNTLLLTDRDPSSPVFSGSTIRWRDWGRYVPDLACRYRSCLTTCWPRVGSIRKISNLGLNFFVRVIARWWWCCIQVLPVGLFSFLLLTRSNRKHVRSKVPFHRHLANEFASGTHGRFLESGEIVSLLNSHKFKVHK